MAIRLSTFPGHIEDLISSSCNGDEQAYRDLVEQLYPRLLSVAGVCCSRYARLRMTPEELVDDTYRQLYQALQKVKPQNVDTILALASHKCSQYLKNVRKKNSRPKVPKCDPALKKHASRTPGPGEVAEQREIRAIIDNVVSGLPPHLRTVWQLSWDQELPQEVIANHLSVETRTVRRWLRDARLALGERLESRGLLPEWSPKESCDRVPREI